VKVLGARQVEIVDEYRQELAFNLIGRPGRYDLRGRIGGARLVDGHGSQPGFESGQRRLPSTSGGRTRHRVGLSGGLRRRRHRGE